MQRFSAYVLSLSLLAGSASAVRADILDELYGSGVHAYFAGQTDKAEELFNEAIQSGSRDPRVYYFRGLNQIRSQGGQVEIGAADFEQGAILEAQGNKVGEISRSLARVQGPARLAIETARRRARLAAKEAQLEMQRNQPAVAPGVPNVGTGVAPAPAANDPFGNERTGLTDGAPTPMPESAAPVEAVPATPAADDNPFGDDPAAPAAPAEDDPFSSDAPAAAAEDDPFAS